VTTKLVNFRLEESLVDALGAAAASAQVTRTQIVRQALEERLRNAVTDESEPSSDESEREEWIRREAVKHKAHGLTTPLAVRKATEDYERRFG
jgi:hypothetical protein